MGEGGYRANETDVSFYETNRLIDIENGFVVAKGGGGAGEGWIENWELADANYYI